MKIIGVIWKFCNLYALSITIIKIKKSNRIMKIQLYNDITDFNDTIIKNAKHIPY